VFHIFSYEKDLHGEPPQSAAVCCGCEQVDCPCVCVGGGEVALVRLGVQLDKLGPVRAAGRGAAVSWGVGACHYCQI
jgi:hypothetical protein